MKPPPARDGHARDAPLNATPGRLIATKASNGWFIDDPGCLMHVELESAIAVEFDQVFERGVLRGEAWADAKASQVQVSRRADLMAHCVDFCLPSLRSCAVSSLLTKTLGRAEGVRHWKQAAPAHLRSAG